MQKINIKDGLNCDFNKIYVIESLDENEEKTGRNLVDTTISVISEINSSFQVEYIEILSLEDWNRKLAQISNDCESNEIRPILHFEIHGDPQLKGLVLKNGDIISVKDFGDALRNINRLSNCNLIITLAVCYGLLSALINVSALREMPFVCAIGSFESIKVEDLAIRFTDFYSVLLSEFDLMTAFKALLSSNSSHIEKYNCYSARDFFISVYKRYIEEQCSPEGMASRAKQCLPSIGDRNQRAKLQFAFIGKEKELRQNCFAQFRDTFFMLNDFPSNCERFDVPKNWRDL